MFAVIFLILLGHNAYAELDDLIKSQDRVVKQHMPKVNNFIKNAKKQAAKGQAQAKSIINNSKLNCNKDFQLDWLNNLDPKQQQNNILGVQVYIFASLSMPKTRLINLIKEANNYNGIVILRGLKNNSYKETAEFSQPIIKEAGHGFVIDPMLFRQYHITKVPTFILKSSDSEVHDKIIGNINLKYALQQFAKHGDLAKEAAKILGLHS